MNVEEAFIRAFIEPDSQERYLGFTANPRRRSKFTAMLYHPRAVIQARMQPIAARNHFPESVGELLRQKGAGATATLISPDPTLDQQEMPLKEALERLIMEDRVAIVSCLPGRLAYWKSELYGYILEHNPATKG